MVLGIVSQSPLTWQPWFKAHMDHGNDFVITQNQFTFLTSPASFPRLRVTTKTNTAAPEPWAEAQWPQGKFPLLQRECHIIPGKCLNFHQLKSLFSRILPNLLSSFWHRHWAEPTLQREKLMTLTSTWALLNVQLLLLYFVQSLLPQDTQMGNFHQQLYFLWFRCGGFDYE